MPSFFITFFIRCLMERVTDSREYMWFMCPPYLWCFSASLPNHCVVNELFGQQPYTNALTQLRVIQHSSLEEKTSYLAHGSSPEISRTCPMSGHHPHICRVSCAPWVIKRGVLSRVSLGFTSVSWPSLWACSFIESEIPPMTVAVTNWATKDCVWRLAQTKCSEKSN